MPNESTAMSKPVMIVAIAVLVGFGGLLAYLFSISAAANETVWNRVIFLYGGVEALAFAAAGFLFGKEVHRQQAEKAEKRADEKTQQAEAAGQKAAAAEAKGRSLSSAIAAKVGQASAKGEVFAALSKESTPLLARSDLEEIDRMARDLFPR